MYKVRGPKAVDASMFPKIWGFYIAIPIYMVSKKPSEVIIEDAKKGNCQ